MDNTEENMNFNSNGEPINFGLPDGYFGSSAKTIFNKIEWLEEHKAFPKLGQLKHSKIFAVPESYFNQTEIKLELLNCPKLGSIEKTNVFKAPTNYFKDIEIIQFYNLANYDENELNQHKTLKSISKQNNFKVDENYFDDFQKKINHKLLNNTITTKVIKLVSPKIYYAVAALLVITLGLWLYGQYFSKIESKDCGTLACVDKVDLIKLKNLESLDNEELYDLVDTKKLKEKLEGKTTNHKDTKKSLDTNLKNLSTENLLDEI